MPIRLVPQTAALASWWNNNSFTPEAIEADDFMTRLKQQKR